MRIACRIIKATCTPTICNTYFFSIARMIARTCYIVTLQYVICLIRFQISRDYRTIARFVILLAVYYEFIRCNWKGIQKWKVITLGSVCTVTYTHPSRCRWQSSIEPTVPSVIGRWKLLYCFSNSVEGSVVDGSRIYAMLDETRIRLRIKIVCESLTEYLLWGLHDRKFDIYLSLKSGEDSYPFKRCSNILTNWSGVIIRL